MAKSKIDQVGKIIIPSNTNPWPHEMRVARILANVGYIVEFIPKSSIKTADILLDGVEFEIKSPRTSKANSLEHLIKKALMQSSNIIFDSSRIRNCNEDKMHVFLLRQAKTRKVLKSMIFVTKQGAIIDIK